MKQSYNIIYSLALATLCASPWSTTLAQSRAGVKAGGFTVLKAEPKLSPIEQQRAFAKFKAEHPLLFKARVRGANLGGQFKDTNEMRQRSLSLGKSSANTDVPSQPMIFKQQSVALGRELWANSLYSSKWNQGEAEYGIYSFGALNGSIDVNSKVLSPYMYANAGGCLVGDRLDVITYNADYQQMIHYVFDANTGEYQTGSYLNDYSLWSTETAVSADGKVYGDFYSADATSFELGVVDYANDTRTTIGQLNRYYVAMGMTKDNKLYGIAVDGNLYTIDTETAKEKLVGPTGIGLTYSDGTWNVQSGEIDQNTGIFYWACTDNKTNSALYTVDLETGHATKVGDFSGNEQLTLLTLPKESVSSSAPAIAGDIRVNFDNTSLTGTVSFTTPSTTYYGDALSGSVDYTVSVDGKAVKSGSAAVGTTVSEPVATTRGMHQFAVVCSNAFGEGPRAYFSQFVGVDTPQSPANVKVALDANTGKTSITWDEVTMGVNGGYVGDVTYDVVRYPDNKSIAENTTSTSATDVLPDGQLTGYYYTVVAKSNGYKSKEAKSNGVTFGEMLEPPYSENFSKESSLNLFTIIDANNDGSTWKYTADDGNGSPAVTIAYNDYNSHNDWLITPPLKLKAGVIYNVTYSVASKGQSYPEELEVMYGSEATADAMVNVLSEKSEITSREYTTIKKELVLDKDGVVYIGFHCTSDVNKCFQLFLNSITVTGNSVKAPAAATDVKVEPATEGKEEATISFVAPSKAIDDTPLTSNLNVDIMRNGETINTMTGVEPGKTYSYVDNSVESGFNDYSVVASNEEGKGRESKAVKAYVGLDTPNEVTDATYATTSSTIDLKWPAVTTGENGGYVDPSDIKYNVYDVYDTGMGAQLTLIDQVSNPSITINYNTNEGEQDMIYYALSAENSKGEGPRSLSPGVLVGKPYVYPFAEHFVGGALDNKMWWITSGKGGSAYMLMQGVSADGDGGCAGYTSSADNDAAILGSGKISLAGAKSPTLLFSHMATATDAKAKTTVYIGTADSEEQVCVLDYSKIDNADKKWLTTSVTLDKKYAAEPYVTFKFVTEAPAGETVYFDRILVRDAVEKDLSAAISAPSQIHKGETVTANVTVNNQGSEAIDAYTVNLYAGDRLVDTKTVAESLPAYSSNKLQLTCKTTVMDASPLKLKAEVVADGDTNPDNDVATADVQLIASTKTSPDNVKATTDGSSVELTWNKISETSETVTDGFDSYTPWDMDNFGEWTAAYGEKGLAKGPFSRSYPHPNEGKRFAYTVAEPATWLGSEMLNYYPCLNTHSGTAYVASFYSVENSQFIPADNWLISPSLTGEKQTISFWANNFTSTSLNYPEDFEVLYSLTGTAIDDFKSMNQKFTADGGEWKQYSVELPEGSTYFAIHNNTADTYMFMIDDVTYTAGCGKVVAYNIYRDGQLLGTVAADSNHFSDASDGKTHTYAVSAVYAGGESEATIADIVTAIAGITADGNATFDVYTVDGKVVAKGVKSLGKLSKGVYVVNGNKVVVK